MAFAAHHAACTWTCPCTIPFLCVIIAERIKALAGCHAAAQLVCSFPHYFEQAAEGSASIAVRPFTPCCWLSLLGAISAAQQRADQPHGLPETESSSCA